MYIWNGNYCANEAKAFQLIISKGSVKDVRWAIDDMVDELDLEKNPALAIKALKKCVFGLGRCKNDVEVVSSINYIVKHILGKEELGKNSSVQKWCEKAKKSSDTYSKALFASGAAPRLLKRNIPRLSKGQSNIIIFA